MKKRTIWSLIFLALGVQLLASCNQGAPEQAILTASTPTATPTATPTPPPTPTPSPVPTNTPVSIVSTSGTSPMSPRGIIEATIQAMQNVRSFHFAIEATVQANTEQIRTEIHLRFEGDFQAPDRARGKLVESLGFISFEIETINIGDTAYVTDIETGEWEVTSGGAFALPGPQDFTSADAFDIEGLTLVGQETLQGIRVFHLRGQPPRGLFGGDQEGEFSSDLWLGVDDFLIRRLVAEGDIPMEGVSALLGGQLGGAGLTGNATMTMTIEFSNYNEPVEIEAPELP